MLGKGLPSRHSLGVGLFPSPFLLALEREGFHDGLVDGLSPSRSECPDPGESKGLMKPETCMGKPFSVLQE